MTEQQEKLQTSFRNQSWTKPERHIQLNKPDPSGQKTECFGLERGNRFVRRFKLFFRDGRVISIPYAYLPVVIYDPDRDLKIKTADLEITVKGRGLDKLADHLNEEKVLWIKESASSVDTEDGEVFVFGITVEGDLMA
ncbi:MAG: hypothetical protein H6577_10025 [Lewinellaceae bacterium]|nr:hypothetical protein [Saprospiraceae bacterium]MCB9338454.1 hypothetical protein [Lewinellaceae bacterium]